MALDVALKKTSMTEELQNRLIDDAKRLDGDEKRARTLAENNEIIVYAASASSGGSGWILYRPAKSNIEEIVASDDSLWAEFIPAMLNSLLDAESLVSCTVAKTDKRKYERLVEYGFRPTRFYEREGREWIHMDLSTSLFLKKIKGRKPYREYKKQERVAIVKTPETRTHEELKTSLKSVIDGLGGLDAFVKKGQTVVIKPNVVAEHGLKNGVYTGGVVTDVRLVKALVEILLSVAGKVIIAEGSSINRDETTKMFVHYGYDKLVDMDPARVSLVDLNADRLVRKPVPDGKRMLSREIPVTLEEADVIINFPVMKTHFAAAVSLSIKNLQGAIPPIEKYMTHFFGLWQNLINIHHLVKPSLILIDGLTAAENFGPVYGDPKEMNLIIGGTNPVAVDAVTMRIMGIAPEDSPPVHLAYMQGLGPIDPERITVEGESVEDLVDPFVRPILDLEGGRDITVHSESACTGCAGYLHFVLHKLRRPDPANPDEQLINRKFDKKVNIYLGPAPKKTPDPEETNVFLGICQQHHAEDGKHLPGCPPHAEVIMKGIYSLFPDIERPQYADKSSEQRLEEMLNEILAGD